MTTASARRLIRHAARPGVQPPSTGSPRPRYRALRTLRDLVATGERAPA